MEFLFSSLRVVLGEELSVLPTGLLSGEAAAGAAGAAGLGSSLALVLWAASAGAVAVAGASFLGSVALKKKQKNRHIVPSVQSTNSMAYFTHNAQALKTLKGQEFRAKGNY